MRDGILLALGYISGYTRVCARTSRTRGDGRLGPFCWLGRYPAGLGCAGLPLAGRRRTTCTNLRLEHHSEAKRPRGGDR